MASFIREQMPAPQLAQRGANSRGGASGYSGGSSDPGAGAERAGVDGVAADGVAAVMRAQIEAMSKLIQQQLDALQRISLAAAVPADGKPTRAASQETAAQPPTPSERPSRFQAYRPVQKLGDNSLTSAQRRHIDELTARFTTKTAGSKRLAATYRPVLADPRAAAGFRPEWKELVYPIVCTRAAGSRIWDIDGNEYIDLVNGYGPIAFGHSADFIVEAVKRAAGQGICDRTAGRIRRRGRGLFTEMTGNERMTFCNTGSEAVMAALRVARAVTGRTKVVLFGGAYHGQFDEVLVRGAKRADGTPRSVPIAAGIPASAVENIVVLDYATAESLQWVRDNAEDLAAVVVEPVQSRHPDLQPFDFLRELRDVTEAAGRRLRHGRDRHRLPRPSRRHAGAHRHTRGSGDLRQGHRRRVCRSASSPARPGSWTRWTAARGITATIRCRKSASPSLPAPLSAIRWRSPRSGRC